MSPLRARIAPADVRLFARAPVRCCASRSQYFGLVELRGTIAAGGGVMTLLCRAPLGRGKPPACVELPGSVRRFATAPGFLCPGCGAAGGGLFVPETGGASDDLLHSCLARYRRDACACGIYERVRYVDCAHFVPAAFTVRGELVAPPKDRDGGPAPPGVASRVQPGGRK